MISPADLLQLLEKRQSTRAYLTQPVEKEKIARCIEAARLAPSACNAQPWKFIVVDDVLLRNKLAGYISSKISGMNHFAKQAPILTVVVREKANFTSAIGQVLKNKEYPLIDIGIASIQYCLQATAEGLGTCIIGWFDENSVRKLLHIPRNKRVELIIATGYAASDETRKKVRKETKFIFSHNGYQ